MNKIIYQIKKFSHHLYNKFFLWIREREINRMHDELLNLIRLKGTDKDKDGKKSS